VKESVASGVSIVELMRKKKVLSAAEIDDVLDPIKMTGPGTKTKRKGKA
jgi:aspartate ammonia-lyase